MQSKLESRDRYSQTWQTTLTKSCPSHPGFFCFAIFCASCASYSNRKKALRDDMSRYICCNGDCPCSGRMKEQDCPEFCLCMEVRGSKRHGAPRAYRSQWPLLYACMCLRPFCSAAATVSHSLHSEGPLHACAGVAATRAA